MRYLVYDVPGRTDHAFQALDLDSAKRWVESQVRVPKNSQNRWTESGGGYMLTIRSARGQMLGHYYLRLDARLAAMPAEPAEVGSATWEWLATAACIGLIIMTAIGLLDGWWMQ